MDAVALTALTVYSDPMEGVSALPGPAVPPPPANPGAAQPQGLHPKSEATAEGMLRAFLTHLCGAHVAQVGGRAGPGPALLCCLCMHACAQRL